MNDRNQPRATVQISSQTMTKKTNGDCSEIVKFIDHSTRKTVNAFLDNILFFFAVLPCLSTVSRHHQRTKPQTKPCLRRQRSAQIIPQLIKDLCAVYFYRLYMMEQWTEHGPYMELDDCEPFKIAKLRIPRAVRAHNNTVYGNINIYEPSNHIDHISMIWKYEWKILILSCIDNLIIGLDSSQKAHTHQDFADLHLHDDHFYAYVGNGKLYSHELSWKGISYGEEYVRGDIVTIQLDVRTKTLQFWRNDNFQGVAFNKVDFSQNRVYHFAVCAPAASEFELIDCKLTKSNC